MSSFETNNPIAIPPPQITKVGILLTADCWLLYSAFYSLIVMYGQGVSFLGVMTGQITQNTFLAVLSVGIWLLVVSYMDEYPWYAKLLTHLVIAPIYAWAGSQFLLLVARSSANPGELDGIRSALPFIFSSNIIAYIVQFAVYHMVRASQRLQYRKTQTMELYALTREQELAQLKAQIHPHFMFNALHSIGAIAGTDPEQVRTLISGLADMMRYTLDNSRRDLVPLHEEIAFVKAYLEIELTRFPDRLRVVYDVDGDAMESMVLPMTLQPLVENAIKHGISPSETGGTITLQAKLDEKELVLLVEDDGIGDANEMITSSKGGGVGLSNTSARLVNRFGPEAALKTAYLVPSGFQVQCTIPQ